MQLAAVHGAAKRPFAADLVRQAGRWALETRASVRLTFMWMDSWAATAMHTGLLAPLLGPGPSGPRMWAWRVPLSRRLIGGAAFAVGQPTAATPTRPFV